MSEPQNAALFPAPPRPELKLSAHFAALPADPSASYADYKVLKRVQCEDCVWTVHEAEGAGGAEIRSGRVKRTSGTLSTILCTGHADLWKKRDGVGGPRGRGRRR